MAELKRRILNLLIALDQFLWNVATLGNVDPDMTLSASSWRSEIKGKWWARIMRPLIDFLFLPLERDHCQKAYLAELDRRQLPGDMHG